MFSRDKVFKFKLRVIVNPDSEDIDYPYLVQKKKWFIWHTTFKSRSEEDAIKTMKTVARHEALNPGSTVTEYTEQDYLSDKLKGHN